MPLPLEDYALIGNTRAAALVGRDGSIDWLCLPRFDSPPAFCALLGGPEHGRWLIAPKGGIRRTRRSYRDGTLLLDTVFETDSGAVQLTDCMTDPLGRTEIVRMVRGLRGSVPMTCEILFRFDYGSWIPWVQHVEGGIRATAGPDALLLHSDVPLYGEDYATRCEMEVSAGQEFAFTLTHFPSHEPPPPAIDPATACESTVQWWREWSGRSTYRGLYRDQVQRSLVTLKALTFAPTGGIVAAPTTSLPEQLGGQRNFDYRFCWLRDATFTLYSLLIAGYYEEARAWREWLLRAAAGRPEDLQIVYGVAGERRLTEQHLHWLPGYANSTPVRTGNAAYAQRQLDVYGEVFDALHVTRRSKLGPSPDAWELQRVLLDFLEGIWSQPDNGIWEVRGPRRQFTHSKVMAWVAFDRAVKSVEHFRLEGPIERWQGMRDRIHAEVCRCGYDSRRRSFVQEYGGKGVDASLLMLPLVGFLQADDPRMLGTIAAVERDLVVDGLVKRYRVDPNLDGFEGGEGSFLPCSFWLVDNYTLSGRLDAARRLFEHLLSLCNDVGLLSEEYDTRNGRLVGNFPQAFSHVSLINSARNLTCSGGPGEHRAKEEAPGGPT